MFKFEKSSNILNIEEKFCSICLKPIHISKAYPKTSNPRLVTRPNRTG